MATSGEHLNTSEGASSASNKTHNATTSATVSKVIPKGIPMFGLAGNGELVESWMQQETAAEGFLKFVGEDEDNLALQKERQEEKQKAESAQGKL